MDNTGCASGGIGTAGREQSDQSGRSLRCASLQKDKREELPQDSKPSRQQLFKHLAVASAHSNRSPNFSLLAKLEVWNQGDVIHTLHLHDLRDGVGRDVVFVDLLQIDPDVKVAFAIRNDSIGVE